MEIRTSKGLLTLSIQRLHVLELASDIREHASIAQLVTTAGLPHADADDLTLGGGDFLAKLGHVGA